MSDEDVMRLAAKLHEEAERDSLRFAAEMRRIREETARMILKMLQEDPELLRKLREEKVGK